MENIERKKSKHAKYIGTFMQNQKRKNAVSPHSGTLLLETIYAGGMPEHHPPTPTVRRVVIV